MIMALSSAQFKMKENPTEETWSTTMKSRTIKLGIWWPIWKKTFLHFKDDQQKTSDFLDSLQTQ